MYRWLADQGAIECHAFLPLSFHVDMFIIFPARMLRVNASLLDKPKPTHIS